MRVVTVSTMKPKMIELDELPKYSPWVERILGLEPFTKPDRTIAKIDSEYDKDKYASLLARMPLGATTIDLRAIEVHYSQIACFSRHGELFVASTDQCQRLQDEALIKSLSGVVGKADTIVELGCGYGYNLAFLRESFPGKLWLGGEYSPNAIKIADRLFEGQPDISIRPFNWYDSDWPILDATEGKTLVFTRHAIEQLPRCQKVMPTFQKYRQITDVVHLEPVYELHGDSTLGLMRRAYTLLNDYNTDLLTTLESMKVNIVKMESDIVGANPLNPTSLVHWRPDGRDS